MAKGYGGKSKNRSAVGDRHVSKAVDVARRAAKRNASALRALADK